MSQVREVALVQNKSSSIQISPAKADYGVTDESTH
jgi:hypothetical protein